MTPKTRRALRAALRASLRDTWCIGIISAALLVFIHPVPGFIFLGIGINSVWRRWRRTQRNISNAANNLALNASESHTQ